MSDSRTLFIPQDTHSVPEPLALESLRSSRDLTHGLYRFPGRFHPALVTYLLSLHPKVEVCGDPMSGSGTVAVESAFVGKSGLYSDIDPLSCLLTRAKSRPVNPKWLTDTFKTILRKARPFAKPGTRRGEARNAIKDLEGSTSFKAPPNVFHWFQPYVATNLSRILLSASEIDATARRRDAVLSVFASVIRRVSRADPATSSGLEVTKIRKEAMRNGLRFDVSSELTRKAAQLAKGYTELRRAPKLGTVRVEEFDVRHWDTLCSKFDEWPELVITSPCYMSAIEYWRRHKLEHCWLGLVGPAELSGVHEKFLGMGNDEPDLGNLPPLVMKTRSKLRRIDRDEEAEHLARYFDDCHDWLTGITKVLSQSKGTAYVVVGSNTTRGLTVDTAGALMEIAMKVGLSAEIFLRYRIKNSYMQYPTDSERIRIESVLKMHSDS